jgi:hypothetical protein
LAPAPQKYHSHGRFSRSFPTALAEEKAMKMTGVALLAVIAARQYRATAASRAMPKAFAME